MFLHVQPLISRRRLATFLAAGLLLLVCTFSAQAETPSSKDKKTDRERIVGTWMTLTFEENGAENADLGTNFYHFDANGTAMYWSRDVGGVGIIIAYKHFELDDSKTPKQLDLILDSPAISTMYRYKTIFELDGDTLIFVLNSVEDFVKDKNRMQVSAVRPSSLKTKMDDHVRRYVMIRVTDPKLATPPDDPNRRK